MSRERFLLESSLMYMPATHPDWHKPIKFDPAILNEDGSFNSDAFWAKLQGRADDSNPQD